jgi:hypothetical protein
MKEWIICEIPRLTRNVLKQNAHTKGHIQYVLRHLSVLGWGQVLQIHWHQYVHNAHTTAGQHSTAENVQEIYIAETRETLIDGLYTLRSTKWNWWPYHENNTNNEVIIRTAAKTSSFFVPIAWYSL